MKQNFSYNTIPYVHKLRISWFLQTKIYSPNTRIICNIRSILRSLNVWKNSSLPAKILFRIVYKTCVSSYGPQQTIANNNIADTCKYVYSYEYNKLPIFEYFHTVTATKEKFKCTFLHQKSVFIGTMPCSL